jgi:hypothetical protein
MEQPIAFRRSAARNAMAPLSSSWSTKSRQETALHHILREAAVSNNPIMIQRQQSHCATTESVEMTVPFSSRLSNHPCIHHSLPLTPLTVSSVGYEVAYQQFESVMSKMKLIDEDNKEPIVLPQTTPEPIILPRTSKPILLPQTPPLDHSHHNRHLSRLRSANSLFRSRRKCKHSWTPSVRHDEWLFSCGIDDIDEVVEELVSPIDEIIQCSAD